MVGLWDYIDFPTHYISSLSTLTNSMTYPATVVTAARIDFMVRRRAEPFWLYKGIWRSRPSSSAWC